MPEVNSDDAHILRGSASVVRLFEWPYSAIGSECARLGRQGWIAVDISSPAASNVANDSQRVFPAYSWPERMLPYDLSNLSSTLGTEAELSTAVSECMRAGVQVYASVALNQVAPNSKTATTRQPCNISTYTNLFGVWQCQPTPALDRNTGVASERRLIARYLNSLVLLGISGFRILDAHLISHEDMAAVMDLVLPLRYDVAAFANVTQVVYLFDPWPFALLGKDAPMQPPGDELPYSLTAMPYLALRNLSFTTDRAWSLRAARAWLCGSVGQPACTDQDELLQLTQASSSLSYAEYTSATRDEQWRFVTNASVTRIERSLSDPALNAFGVRECANGRDVCADVLTGQYSPDVAALATVWMFALPGGPTTVFSSYKWARHFNATTGADENWFTGPPRMASGAVAPVLCASDLSVEGRVGGGTEWNCEHRHALVEVMPLWRTEVDNTWEVQFLKSFQAHSVAFARGAESRGGFRRHGWVLIHAGTEPLEDLRIETGAP